MTQDNRQPWGQPQYGQQPQYAPYQPPQPPKKHRGRNITLGIIGAAVFVTIVASITDSIASPKTPTAAVAVTTQQPAASNPAAPAAARVEKVVLEGAGNGIKNTADFTTGDNWSIAYTFNCASFGARGNFQIYVYDGSDLVGVPANELAMKGGATSYEHGDSGTHYLEINSECAWTVKVTDGDGGQ